VTEPTRFAPDDLMRIAVADETRLAPGGALAAVRIVEPDLVRDERVARIDVIDVASGDPIRTLEAGASLPRWLPDGRTLCYVSPRGSGQALVAVDPSSDASPTEMVVGIDLEVRELEISPDGRAAALAGTRPRQPNPLAELPFGGSPERRPFVIDHPVFRGVEAALLAPVLWELVAASLDDGSVRSYPVPDGMWADETEEAEGFELDWFPAGGALVVSLSTTWDAEHQLPDPHRDLVKLDLSSGSYLRLTDDPHVCVRPKVSPDGSAVAFLRQRGDAEATVFQYEVCLLDLASSSIRPISEGHDLDIWDLAWHPDGEALLIGYVERGLKRIARLGRDGRIEELTFACGPVFDVTRDGQVAAVTSDPVTPGDPAIVHRDGEVRRVRRLDPWLDERTPSTLRAITYPSAHPDGLEIHAMVAHPTDVDDPSRLPVVVDLHGGPFSAKGWWFDADREFFSGQGFVVIQPNYRGSTGYGQAFMQLSDRRHYPGWYDEPNAPHEMGLDVVGAIDAARAQGLGDPDRVFLRGISAGAIVTTWTLGRTDRFRAAVANSWYPGEWGAPMYGRYQLRRYFDAPPWDPMHALDHQRRSPIMLADRIRTPLLLVHGERDFFTPQLEVERFFHAVRGRGVDVTLVTFPDETHGVRCHPASIRSSRVMEVEWFRSHDTTAGRA
jgi:dipeptidyl aminopeptidase/acylaminoacyl peptidase